jgi:gliding motility-associated protein GldM
MRGSVYRANIGVLAVDTTQRPRIFVNNRQLPDEANGRYTAAAGSTGKYDVRGYVEMPQGDGSLIKRDFSTQYYVVEPTAIVAPVLMRVLYAGYNNDISISVPGTPSQNVSATSSNGNLTAKGNDIWTVNPKLGTDAVITVTAKMPDGRTQEMGRITFRVRPLPDPTPYLNITNPDGNRERYKGGGRPIAKAALVAVDALSAAIDDGILDQPFTVVRFDLMRFDNRGFSSTLPSNGAYFTQQQKDAIRETERGKILFIRGIEVQSPAGDRRTLNAPMEIRVN